MKKLLIFLMLFTFAFVSFSQEKNENKMFVYGYINFEEDNFMEVVVFMQLSGNVVTDICEQDGLILFHSSIDKFDEHEFAREIESYFGGKCYVKLKIESFYQSSCRGRIEKDKYRK